MSDTNKPHYWAVLPAIVRYDPDLTPSAKLLYAEISALCDQSGYCFAYNRFFAKNFGLSEKSVARLIRDLADKRYIAVEVIRDPATREVVQRRIFAGLNPAGELPTPSPQKWGDPSPQNCGDPSPQNCGDPSPQNCGVYQDNNIIIPPYSPPKGAQVGKHKRENKEHPDWKPDRFEGFWKFYPKKGRKNKQRAIRAWDRLQPSDELIARMAKALVEQLATEEWQRGIGIPHAATWLNDRRWEDETEAAPQDTGGWAEDEEVI